MADDQPLDPPMNSRAFGCLVGSLLAPVMLLFLFFGQRDRGVAIVIVATALLMAAYQTRDAAKANFYVGIVPPLFVAQLLGAFLTPLPQSTYLRASILPLAIIIFVFNIAVIRVSQRLFGSASR
jgi:hypothetical protein